MFNREQIPKVAIITRTKDRSILLERAIKSVHQQRMQDFIHVIVNDGGNPKAVDDLVKKYEHLIKGRVKVIHNQVSGGMEAASNKAIKSVDSLYVAIHDDDDSWHPDFLMDTTTYLDTNASMGVVVTTDRIEEQIIGTGVQEVLRERWMPELRTLTLYRLAQDNFAVPISFIYRRDVFDEVGYYDADLPVCGDWDFALRFMRKYDIFLLQKPYALAYYHHRPKATGTFGNSVFAGADTHEAYRAILENKYLRDDLTQGGLGLGYLFNKRRVDRIEYMEMQHRLDIIYHELNELEKLVVDRTNYKQKIKKTLQKVSPRLYRSVKKIVRR